MVRFALTTMVGMGQLVSEAEFFFQGKELSELKDPERHFTLSAEDVVLLNPNTRTCPIFRSKADAELTKAIYRRVPVLIKEGPPEENPWGITFKQGLFNMTSDSQLFRTREQLEAQGWRLEGNVFVRGKERYLSLYEAKMIYHYNHRHGDYALVAGGKRSHVLPEVPTSELFRADYAVLPYYWPLKRRLMLAWRNDRFVPGCWVGAM